MKTFLRKRFPVLIAIAAIVFVCAACGDRAKPGTALAARFMAAEAVGKMFDVEPVWVKKDPVVNGDMAKVVATFKDQECDLELAKSMTANQYGWVMKSIQCGKVAS